MTVSLSAQHQVRFYGSADFKEWDLLGEFGPAGATAGVWECPDLFELRVENTKEKRWVLVVNINPGSIAGGSGGQYFVGQFDGKRFVADQTIPRDTSTLSASESALWFDYGPDYYAAVSWSDVPKADGRRLWLGWMSNWQYGQDVPTSPWRSAMSVPRELSLRETAEGIRLVQKPVRELESLRRERFRFAGGDLAEANSWLSENRIQGQQLEIEVDLEPKSNATQGLRLLAGTTEQIVVGVERERPRVFVNRTHSGNVGFHPRFSGIYEAPLVFHDSKVKFHVFVDACSIELFVNEGENVFTSLVFPSRDSRRVELFGPNEMKVKALQVWKLRSIWN